MGGDRVDGGGGGGGWSQRRFSLVGMRVLAFSAEPRAPKQSLRRRLPSPFQSFNHTASLAFLPASICSLSPSPRCMQTHTFTHSLRHMEKKEKTHKFPLTI